ncbi:zona pellucida sperm-binding protein 4-like [Trichomycterus rosablanca]|uniref:zona pellucida sperm-binding protein 4-like n=1 Tax=Trichomycterus rosablanca TaxID=2290929 RepID=UPI002F35E687
MADMSMINRLLVLYALLILCHAITPTQRFLGLRPRASEPQQTEQQIPSEIPPHEPAAIEELSQRCAVEEQEKVQCGQAGITATDCASIQCCFNGTQCYYGKAVTVQCIRDGQFVVVVARDTTVPQLSLDSVHLLGNEASCSPVGITAAFTIYQFPVTACGTKITEKDGHVIYENAMTSSYDVEIGPLGAIMRDSHFKLLFQCRYSVTAVEAMVLKVDGTPPLLPVAVSGPLRLELRLGNGQCTVEGCMEGDVAYSSYYNETDYPVTKVLRDPVYVEVRILERTDPSIVLTLGRCWATSSSDLLSLPQWDLLVDGCPYSADRHMTNLVPLNDTSGLQFPTHYKRFIVKMFAFVDQESLTPLRETVFIHCTAAVCLPTESDRCEQKCSRQRREVSLATKTSSNSVVVSSGKLVLVYM